MLTRGRAEGQIAFGCEPMALSLQGSWQIIHVSAQGQASELLAFAFMLLWGEQLCFARARQALTCQGLCFGRLLGSGYGNCPLQAF
eukprot:2229709-Amphidinium_carterae.1